MNGINTARPTRSEDPLRSVLIDGGWTSFTLGALVAFTGAVAYFVRRPEALKSIHVAIRCATVNNSRRAGGQVRVERPILLFPTFAT